jgi:hypothetical protein
MPTWRGNTYRFTVTAATAAAGDTYTNNGQAFTVTDAIAGGTVLYCFGTGAPTATGNLVRATGAGTNPIVFSAFTGPNTNWGTATNWLENAIPTTTTTAVFDAQSRDCIVNTNARACSDFTTTNYTNTITFDFDVQVNGNITLGAGMLFGGTAFLNLRFASAGLTRNVNCPSALTIPRLSYNGGNSGTITFTNNTTITNLTCTDGANVTYTFSPVSGSVTITISGGTFNTNSILNGAARAILNANTTLTFSGTSTLTAFTNNTIFLGSGTIQTASGANLTINRNWNYTGGSGGTINFSQGTVSFGSTTFTQGAALTLNFPASVGVFNNIDGGSTLTLQSDVAVAGNYGLPGTGGLTHTINGAFNFIARSNINMGGGNTIAGNATLRMETTANAAITVASNSSVISIANFIIDKGTGILTLPSSTLTFSGAVYTLTSGTISHAGTIQFSNNKTITHTVSASYNFINFATNNATQTINGNPLVANQITSNINQTFAGDRGFTTGTFSAVQPTSPIALTFANVNASPNVEYIVTGQLTIRGTESGRIILQSAGSTGNFLGTANGTTFTGSQANLAAGMTISQATGQAPTGFSNLFPARPVIVSGGPSSWVMDLNVTPSTGSITMRAGFKAKLTLQAGASQEVAFVTTQDIDSSAGQTIYAFLSNTDSAATNVNLFRTLNWGPLVAPSGSSFYTWVC